MIPELTVPFLRNSEIERAAEALLCRYAKWKGAAVRPPIDIDNIIEGYLRLELAFIDLPDLLGIPDVLGATFIEERRIFVDESLDLLGKEGRLTFTLAHEVGHWDLHRPMIEAQKATAPLFAKGDIAEQPTIVCRTSQKKARAELQADRFAAALLMPAADVRAAVSALYGDKLPSWDGLDERRKQREFDMQLHALAGEVIERGRFSNVSNEAMRNRLFDLKLVVDSSAPQISLL